MSELHLDDIRHALTVAREHGLKSVRLKVGDHKFSAVLGSPSEPNHEETSAAIVDMIDAPAGPAYAELKSPCVGYIQELSLNAGAKLEPGDKVGLIQALGLKNDITAKKGGEVVEVLVKAGDAVEFGQVIAKLEVK